MTEQVGVRESARRGRAHDFKRSVVKQRKRSKFVLTFAIPKVHLISFLNTTQCAIP